MTKLGSLLAVALTAALLAEQPDAAAVRDRLDRYLDAYQAELSALVAREVMTQTIEVIPGGTSGRREFMPTAPRSERKLESEIAFVSLPGEGGWLGTRAVRKVDGRNIAGTPQSITALLQSADPLAAAKALLDASAQHNLGSVRNTNLPNLPLELLHPRHRERFTYTVTGSEKIEGDRVTVLKANEIARPTIVRGPSGEAMPSQISAWIDEAGRLRRALVSFYETRDRLTQSIRVEFRRYAELGVLVPTEMREDFNTGAKTPRGLSIAKYSEFRRFQTSARILPPPQ